MKAPNIIYKLYLELQQKHGDARQYWPGWCAKRKSLKLREEIAIGAILTQRTNWRNVEMALTNLRQQRILSIKSIYNIRAGSDEFFHSTLFSDGLMSNALARRQFSSKDIPGRSGAVKNYHPPSLTGKSPRASYAEFLGDLIRPTGFYHQKARRLWEFCRMIMEEYGGLDKFRKLKIGEARGKLLSLWGIGPETADSILLYALGKPSFVVDEYTKRLFRRKKLLKNLDYDYVKGFCEQNLPRDADLYQDFHALIVVEEKGEKAAKMR